MFNGKTIDIIADITDEMKIYAEAARFEKAAICRDIIDNIKSLFINMMRVIWRGWQGGRKALCAAFARQNLPCRGPRSTGNPWVKSRFACVL